MEELRVRDVVFGRRRRFVLVAGPCVIEDEGLVLSVAERLAELCRRLAVGYVFKSSFDKANRTSAASFRGPGLESGLRILAKVSREVGVPVLTDIHEPWQAGPAAEVVDILQIPAFLMRQTDLVAAAGRTGKPVNIKKAQYASVVETLRAAEKAKEAGAAGVLLTERGTVFGYHDLVVDFRNLGRMRDAGYPVVFDGTHSVQSPGGGGDRTTGRREFVPLLCRAAVAAGVEGVFLETHPEPDRALSDASTMVPLAEMGRLLEDLVRIDDAVKASA